MTEPVPFQRGVVAPFAVYGEAFRMVKGQYWLLLGITVVGVLLGAMAPMALLMGPMYCGIYGCYRDKWHGRPVKFETLFKGGFESFIFLQSFLATLIKMAASLVVIFPMMIVLFATGFVAGFANTRGGTSNVGATLVVVAIGGAVVLFLAAVMVLGALFAFTFPLIMDRRLRAEEAVKLSVRAAWANIGGLLGVAFVGFATGLLGCCAAYVGALLVMPFTFAAHAVAYERVFGFANATAEPKP